MEVDEEPDGKIQKVIEDIGELLAKYKKESEMPAGIQESEQLDLFNDDPHPSDIKTQVGQIADKILEIREEMHVMVDSLSEQRKIEPKETESHN